MYSDFHPSWTERGWQRTFRDADGATLVVAFVPHAIDAHLAALECAGLVGPGHSRTAADRSASGLVPVLAALSRREADGAAR